MKVTYSVVIAGCLPGVPLNLVARKLASSEKISLDEAKFVLGSGAFVAKSEVDRSTAIDYRASLESYGCACRIEQEGAVDDTVAPPTAGTTATTILRGVDALPSGLDTFGDFWVYELQVKPGEQVEAEQTLFRLECASMLLEMPAPARGIVSDIRAAVGQPVVEGVVALTMLVSADDAGAAGFVDPDHVPTVRKPRREAVDFDQLGTLHETPASPSRAMQLPARPDWTPQSLDLSSPSASTSTPLEEDIDFGLQEDDFDAMLIQKMARYFLEGGPTPATESIVVCHAESYWRDKVKVRKVHVKQGEAIYAYGLLFDVIQHTGLFDSFVSSEHSHWDGIVREVFVTPKQPLFPCEENPMVVALIETRGDPFDQIEDWDFPVDSTPGPYVRALLKSLQYQERSLIAAQGSTDAKSRL